MFKPYLSVRAVNNQFNNSIELHAIYVKNRDPTAYQDK